MDGWMDGCSHVKIVCKGAEKGSGYLDGSDDRRRRRRRRVAFWDGSRGMNWSCIEDISSTKKRS